MHQVSRIVEYACENNEKPLAANIKLMGQKTGLLVPLALGKEKLRKKYEKICKKFEENLINQEN